MPIDNDNDCSNALALQLNGERLCCHLLYSVCLSESLKNFLFFFATSLEQSSTGFFPVSFSFPFFLLFRCKHYISTLCTNCRLLYSFYFHRSNKQFSDLEACICHCFASEKLHFESIIRANYMSFNILWSI